MADNLSGTITLKIIVPNIGTIGDKIKDTQQQVAKQIKDMGGGRFSPLPAPPFQVPKNIWPPGMYGLGGYSTQKTAQEEQKEDVKEAEKREREDIRNLRDEALVANRIQKEETVLNKPAMKAISKYLPLMMGVGGLAGILSQSKIISETTAAVGSILGAYVDLFLLNFIPLIRDTLKILAAGIQVIRDPSGAIEGLVEEIGENISSLFNKMTQSVAVAIPEYTQTYGQKIMEQAIERGTMPQEAILEAAGLSDIAEDIYYMIRETEKMGREVGLTSEEVRRRNEQTKQIAQMSANIVAVPTPTSADPVREARIRLAQEKEVEERDEAFRDMLRGGSPFKWLWEFADEARKRITGNYDIDVNINIVGNPFATPEEIAAQAKMGVQSALDEAEKRGQ